MDFLHGYEITAERDQDARRNTNAPNDTYKDDRKTVGKKKERNPKRRGTKR
jgi:hypothetical protein